MLLIKADNNVPNSSLGVSHPRFPNAFDNLWTGITKPYAQVKADGEVTDCCISETDFSGSFGCTPGGIRSEDLRGGWVNPDGSPLYNSQNDSQDAVRGPWKNDDQCNNIPGFLAINPQNHQAGLNPGQGWRNTHTIWQNQGLIDTDPDWGFFPVFGAIYKCCYEFTSCSD